MNTSIISKVVLLPIMLMLIACQAFLKPSTSPSPVTNTSAPPAISSPTTIPSATETTIPTATFIPTATLASETDFIKGVWFVDWGLGPGVDTLDGVRVLEDIIVPLGANWISLTVACSISFRSPSLISCFDSEVSSATIRQVTSTAHSLGLRVALFAFVLEVSGVPDGWSANLDYGGNQEKWNSYFEAYAGTLLPYAKLAEESQIDLLIIGGEQTGTQKQETHWRSVIEKVRAVYHGPITYEAWCDTSSSVKWWDAVDYIGINFYCFPLSQSGINPSDEEVKRNYIKFLKMIRDQTTGWNKQIIFTEIGYQSTNGVAQIVPFGLTPVRLDVEEQSILVRNFFAALNEFGNEDQWLKGLFWYNYTSSPYIGGMGDLNFTPHNKPAEVYIRSFYTGQKSEVLPELPIQVDETRLQDSYWLFSDKLENRTVLGRQEGNGKAKIVPDPVAERGDVIRAEVFGHWDGLRISLAPAIDFRSYDYLELYIYAPRYEPNLEVWFENKQRNVERPWLYIRSYLDREPLADENWHRISIPVNLLFPADSSEKDSNTSSICFIHMWPGHSGALTFYVDDVRLVKVPGQ